MKIRLIASAAVLIAASVALVGCDYKPAPEPPTFEEKCVADGGTYKSNEAHSGSWGYNLGEKGGFVYTPHDTKTELCLVDGDIADMKVTGN